MARCLSGLIFRWLRCVVRRGISRYGTRCALQLRSKDKRSKRCLICRHQNIPVYPSHYNTKNKDTDVNLKWQFHPNQNILVGVSHLSASYDSNNITNNHQKNDTTGYYAQHQFNHDKLNTQLGIRLEDNERYGNHTVGQGAIRYHITPKASVFANVGTAFRAPTLDEIYSSFYVANPNLKPEESLSYEVGADVYVNDHTKVYASAHQTRVDNLIRTACLSDPSQIYCPNNTQNTNIDKAQFTGGEVGIKWHFGNFFTNAEYAYIKTENRSANDIASKSYLLRWHLAWYCW